MYKTCEICGKTLASNYSYTRHKMTQHPNNLFHQKSYMSNEDMEDDTSSISTPPSDANESSDEHDEVDHIDRGNQNPFWRALLSNTYSEMNELPENFEELKTYKYFSELTDILKSFYDKHKFLSASLEKSKIEDKLYEYKELLVEKGFSYNDAAEASWEHLKFLFKSLIDGNKDLFEDEMKDRQ